MGQGSEPPHHLPPSLPKWHRPCADRCTSRPRRGARHRRVYPSPRGSSCRPSDPRAACSSRTASLGSDRHLRTHTPVTKREEISKAERGNDEVCAGAPTRAIHCADAVMRDAASASGPIPERAAGLCSVWALTLPSIGEGLADPSKGGRGEGAKRLECALDRVGSHRSRV